MICAPSSRSSSRADTLHAPLRTARAMNARRLDHAMSAVVEAARAEALQAEVGGQRVRTSRQRSGSDSAGRSEEIRIGISSKARGPEIARLCRVLWPRLRMTAKERPLIGSRRCCCDRMSSPSQSTIASATEVGRPVWESGRARSCLDHRFWKASASGWSGATAPAKSTFCRSPRV